MPVTLGESGSRVRSGTRQPMDGTFRSPRDQDGARPLDPSSFGAPGCMAARVSSITTKVVMLPRTGRAAVGRRGTGWGSRPAGSGPGIPGAAPDRLRPASPRALPAVRCRSCRNCRARGSRPPWESAHGSQHARQAGWPPTPFRWPRARVRASAPRLTAYARKSPPTTFHRTRRNTAPTPWSCTRSGRSGSARAPASSAPPPHSTGHRPAPGAPACGSRREGSVWARTILVFHRPADPCTARVH